MTYSTKVIDHYENPRNVGAFDKNDAASAPASARRLRRRDEAADQGEHRWEYRGRQVQDVRLRFGDRIVVACHRMGEGQVARRSADHQEHPDRRAPGVAAVKIHCSAREDAIKAAISDYRQRRRHKAIGRIETRSLEGAKERYRRHHARTSVHNL